MWASCGHSWGLATYFRKFVRQFASLASPLYRLLRQDVSWCWDQVCLEAFNALKRALTNAPCLAYPDFSKTFEVHCDASLAGLGAVLYQDGRPVAYESRRLTPAERNYPTGEQELLAVIHALMVWRCYLEGSPEFRVVTDHKAITYLDTLPTLSRRQTRWAEFLSRFNFRWDHTPGSANVVADALSRHPSDYTAPITLINACVLGGCWQPVQRCLPELPLCAHLCALRPAGVEGVSVTGSAGSWKRKFVDGYATDPWFQVETNVEGLIDYDGFLLKEGKAVVPDVHGLRAHILQELHDSPYAGHQGVKRTLALVRRHYWWPTLNDDVERHVLTCHLCQKNKARNTKPAGLLQPLRLPQSAWHTVTMDFITQIPKTTRGYDAIFVVVDKLTKMVHLMPTTTQATAAQTAKLYADNVWKLHGVPEVIVSDRDPLFTSNFTRSLCQLIGTKQAMSTAYHPQTDGQTERVNRVLEDMLRMYVAKSQDDWDEKLTCAEFAINNSDHESTGFTPFVLNYGYHPRVPIGVLPAGKVPAATDFVQRMQRLVNEARVTHRVATARQAQYANTRRRDVRFGVGDWVLLSSKNVSRLARLNSSHVG